MAIKTTEAEHKKDLFFIKNLRLKKEKKMITILSIDETRAIKGGLGDPDEIVEITPPNPPLDPNDPPPDFNDPANP